jgi:hypothetical protein
MHSYLVGWKEFLFKTDWHEKEIFALHHRLRAYNGHAAAPGQQQGAPGNMSVWRASAYHEASDLGRQAVGLGSKHDDPTGGTTGVLFCRT